MERNPKKPDLLHVHVASDDNEGSAIPSISALFLILFDNKIGYTIEWKRALPPIKIEGIVEYKSLPSGLHSVKEDLIYFVHEDYVGLSAFVNAPATEDLRNACMIAVGVLIPLTHFGLERSWKHAELLKEIASKLASNSSMSELLEDYWEKHKVHGSHSQNGNSYLPNLPVFPKLSIEEAEAQGDTSPVSESSQICLLSQEKSTFDPRWDFASLLETFGPLIFPIHRAALLRKRILIMTCTPVRETCNLVYGISVLSTVNHLATGSSPLQRLRPLFSIGVTDIPLLETDLQNLHPSSLSLQPEASETGEFSGDGWVACTTDRIIATKNNLYDILITMSSSLPTDINEKQWPGLETAWGVTIRATQRDLRRYKTLKWGLSRSLHKPSSPVPPETDAPREESSESPKSPEDLPLDFPATETITEPITWSALAYSGLLWWGSTVEQQTESFEEMNADLALISEFQLPPKTPTDDIGLVNTKFSVSATYNTAIISYFYQLNIRMFSSFSEIVDATEMEDSQSDDNSLANIIEESEDELRPAVFFNKVDIARIGLDIWSPADHLFIQNFADKYYGRRAMVEQISIEMCGVKIC